MRRTTCSCRGVSAFVRSRRDKELIAASRAKPANELRGNAESPRMAAAIVRSSADGTTSLATSPANPRRAASIPAPDVATGTIAITRAPELTSRMRARKVGFSSMRSLHPTRTQSKAATPRGSSRLSAGRFDATRRPHSARRMYAGPFCFELTTHTTGRDAASGNGSGRSSEARVLSACSRPSLFALSCQNIGPRATDVNGRTQ